MGYRQGAPTSIGNASGEGVIGLGTDAWNFADGFTKIKILKILIEVDLLEVFSKYGYQNIDDYATVDVHSLPRIRCEALDRYIFAMKQLIGNCEFSIDDKKDKEIINQYIERLNNVEQVINGIATVCTNDLTKEDEIVINEEHFNNCFNTVKNIKDELNFPLNRAGLIFRHSDEIDLDKMMRGIIEGG